MHNDPELNAKYMGSISSDFVKVADALKEASYALRSRGISDFPVFPVSLGQQPIGAMFRARKEGLEENMRNYYISFLDEFVQRELVADEAAFKNAYLDPDEYCCLFIVEPDFTNFVFIPYPED
ncbi:MAG: hypothetical protein V4543_18450 [Bacteroidota bacterium]